MPLLLFPYQCSLVVQPQGSESKILSSLVLDERAVVYASSLLEASIAFFCFNRSTSMAMAMASQFRIIPPKKLYQLFVEAHRAKSLIRVGQTFMRGENVTPVTSHYRSP